MPNSIATVDKTLPKARRDALQQRQDVIQSMNPSLKNQFTDISNKINQQAEEGLRFYRWLGEKVVQIESDTETYGEGGVAKIAQAMTLDPSLLYKARALYNEYTDDEFTQLLTIQADGMRDHGNNITWGHVIQLLSLKDKPKRLELQQQIVREGLTPHMLSEIIQKAFGGPRGSGGRPLSRPKSAQGGLVQIRTETSKWLNRANTVWNSEEGSVFQAVAETPPDQYTEAMREELEKVVSLSDEAAKVASGNAKQAKTLLQQVTRALKNPQQAESKPKASTAGGGRVRPDRRSSTAKAAAKAAKKAGGKAGANAPQRRRRPAAAV